jgi:serine/threonine protein kinase
MKHLTSQRIRKKCVQKKIRTIKRMSGGKFLGEGTFGCVVTPPLSCGKPKSKKLAKRISIARNNVSKIIKTFGNDSDESVKNEINISNILKRIDPNERYFIYIKEHCTIRSVPKERRDMASVKFTSNDFSEAYLLDKKNLDKKYCDIDLTYDPSNLILSNGGYEMGDALYTFLKYYSSNNEIMRSNINKIDNDKTRLSKEEQVYLVLAFLKNFKKHFRHLLEGIYKLHQHRIANRDIKIENMMIDWTDSRRKDVIIRYIDFGLSENLTHTYCSSKKNFHAIGTPEFIPPDIVIISTIKYDYRYSIDYIMSKIQREYENGVKKIHRELKLNYSDLHNLTKSLVTSMQRSFLDNSLLELYFGKDTQKFNGYVQKSDIYALGLTIYEIVHKFAIIDPNSVNLSKNIKLIDLLKNMFQLDPDKRYNIIQCLQHPYFLVL